MTPGSLVTGSSPIPLEGWFPIFDTLHGKRDEEWSLQFVLYSHLRLRPVFGQVVKQIEKWL